MKNGIVTIPENAPTNQITNPYITPLEAPSFGNPLYKNAYTSAKIIPTNKLSSITSVMFPAPRAIGSLQMFVGGML